MNLFVAATSYENIDPSIMTECQELLQELAVLPKLNLVFGAYNKGLMETSYQEFKKAHKYITGVTTAYHDQEHILQEYDNKIITNTTSERFGEIFKNSDVLLFLPGGLGTLAELFSAIDERTIANGKKIILFNSYYHYTPLLNMLYKMHEAGFITEVPADYMTIESDKNEIIKIIKKELNLWKN